MTSILFSRKRRSGKRRGGRLPGAVAGIAAGAGLMVLLDPRRGGSRRSRVVQRARRVLRDAEGSLEAGARDLQHRARGLAHEAVGRMAREAAPDEVVCERVRAKLGRLAAHPSAITVTVSDGHVELSGPVFSAEHGQVLWGVRLVRGVRSVEDHLEAHDTAEGVPALQGAGPHPGPRPDPLQRHWAPRTRLLAGAAGMLLLGRALFGSGLGRIPAGIFGAALLGKVVGDSGPIPRERRMGQGPSERERGGPPVAGAHAGAWSRKSSDGSAIGRGADATGSAAGSAAGPEDPGTPGGTE
jgi:osmotically-inducible protein OsmY